MKDPPDNTRRPGERRSSSEWEARPTKDRREDERRKKKRRKKAEPTDEERRKGEERRLAEQRSGKDRRGGKDRRSIPERLNRVAAILLPPLLGQRDKKPEDQAPPDADAPSPSGD